MSEFAGVYKTRLRKSQGARDVTLPDFPWRLVEELTEVDAESLAPLLDSLLVLPGDTLAAQCARVVDLGTDPQYSGPADWRSFGAEIDRLAKCGVPGPPLALAVLAARAHHGDRQQRHAGDDNPRGSYAVRVQDAETDTARLVHALRASVEALDRHLGARLQAGDNHQGRDATRRAWGAFPCPDLLTWWDRHRQTLRRVVAEARDSLDADCAVFGASGTLAQSATRGRAAVTPGSGNREGHYHGAVYAAADHVHKSITAHWRRKGALDATCRLFGSAGLPLTPSAIRGRRHPAGEA